MRKYKYTLVELQDAKDTDTVFVPNANAYEAFQLLRYFTGLRKDFPWYMDGSIRVTGIHHTAWCKPKVYRESYAPPDMPCIIRSKA